MGAGGRKSDGAWAPDDLEEWPSLAGLPPQSPCVSSPVILIKLTLLLPAGSPVLHLYKSAGPRTPSERGLFPEHLLNVLLHILYSLSCHFSVGETEVTKSQGSNTGRGGYYCVFQSSSHIPGSRQGMGSTTG